MFVNMDSGVVDDGLRYFPEHVTKPAYELLGTSAEDVS